MTVTQFVQASGVLQVRITPGVWQVLEAYRQLRIWQRERGGVLLASSVGASDGIVEIIKITTPDRNDRAGRHWLRLDHSRVLHEIRQAFDEGLHFVGYWHTHPQRSPQLSTQDVAAILPAVQTADLDLQRILMVVVGGYRALTALDVCVVDCADGSWERLLPARTSSAEPPFLHDAQGHQR